MGEMCDSWLCLARAVNADRLGRSDSLTTEEVLVTAGPAHVVSRDGTSIAVWQSGEGPPLVLIHGAAADHSRWAPVLPALEQRFTVFAVDRRGRGRSGDANDYALEREFDDVVAVVESAGEAVNVLGHSYGGICALEAALLTDRIRKLVLYEWIGGGLPLGAVIAREHHMSAFDP